MGQKSQNDWFVYLLFSQKYHCCYDHILAKKRPFSEKQTVLIFPYFVKKRPKRHFSEKQTLLIFTYFVKKNCHSPKNTMMLCHFIQIFYAKPPARMPKFVQKLQFCQNYTIWLRKKKKKKKKKVDFRGSGRGGFEHLWQLLGSNSHNLLLEWTFFSQNMGMRS